MDLVVETGAPSNLILACPYPSQEASCSPIFKERLNHSGNDFSNRLNCTTENPSPWNSV